MKKLIGIYFFLQGFIAFSQPARLSQLNLDHFTVREKKFSDDFSKLIPPAFLNNPDLGIMPFEAPPCTDCIELIDRRDANSRYFVKENTQGSQFMQQNASGPINYLDVNGFWREINYRLEEPEDKLFIASHQPDPVTFDLQGNFITIQNSNYIIQTKIPELIWRETNGTEHNFGIGDFSNYSAGDDGVIIHNIYPDIDFVFSIRSGEVETNFVLNQRLPYGSGEIVLKQQIDLPEKLSFGTGRGISNHQEISIDDSNHIPVFIIEKGYAFDNLISSEPFRISSKVVDSLHIEFSLPMSWLNDPATVYPVIIDPKISTQNSVPLIGISGTKYSPVCWTNGCDYFLNINTPPNVTVTKFYHSFEFYATGLCYADDGGYSIDFLTCHSPAGSPGVYTNPIHISNAYFTADTVVIPEFNSCIPAPQCASQSFSFTLHFYRCNNDTDPTCSSNCIRATKPWTIYIVGYTLQLSNITPTQLICENTNAQLTVTPQYGVAPYTYLWSPGGETNDTITVSPNVSTTYSVTVTDACGLTTSGTSSVNITANNNPGFTLSPNPVCENSPVTLGGNGSGNPSDYDWIVSGSDAAGGIVNDNQTPVISYPSPGNYNVILSYANGVCSFKDTIPITVTSLSTVSVSINAQPSAIACQGDTVTFKANPVNGGLTPSYEWFIDGLNVQNGSSDSLVTSSFVNGSIIKVILHTSAYCAAPSTDTASLTVTVNTALTPQISILPDTTVCPGSPLILNTTSINAGSTPTYQWFKNGVPIGGATNSSYSFNFTPPDTIISVRLNSSLNCITSVLVYDTASINILRNLQTQVNITANPPGIICAGQSVIYTAHAQNGGGGQQFQWYINGVLNSETDSVLSVIPSNNDSISVRLISSITCVMNSSDDDFIIAAISPSVSPSVSLSANPSNIFCAGDTIVFIASATNAGSTPVFSWTLNGNPVGSNDSTFVTSSLNTNDNVRVILTSSLVCAPVISDTDFVTVTVSNNVVPSVTISITGNIICAGDSVQFVANAINGGGAPGFQWFVNGIAKGINNDTIFLSSLNNGDTVGVSITSSLSCVNPISANSSVIISSVQPRVMPQIDITVSPADTICIGQPVLLKAKIINGGNSPAINWFVNSIIAKDTSLTFLSATFGEGDVIVATLNSNANCLTEASDTSNFVRIVYYNPLNVFLTSGAPECPGSPVTIKAFVSGGNGGPYHLIWSTGIKDKDSIIINADKNSKVFIQAEDNCTVQPATFSYTVPVLIGPVADFAYVNPSPGSFQNNIQFINLSKDADSWIWFFPESYTTSTELNPLHQFPKQGTYDVILATRNNDGCVDTIKYIVNAQEEIAVFYPNSFSPNGDGINETFQPIGASLEEYEITIWDRWGEMIYKGNSKSAWNGMNQNKSTMAPEGVYIFRIDLIEEKFENRIVTGRVTLMR